MVFIPVMAISFSCLAQDKSACPPSENKKAQKYYEQALDARAKHREFKEVLEWCAKALEEDPELADAYRLQGDIAYTRKDYKSMRENYVKSIEKCPDVGYTPYYRLGSYFYDKQDYAEAVKYLRQFLEFGNAPEDMEKTANLKIFRAGLYQHPVPFNPTPVEGLSTPDPEYLPCISPDNDFCFFTRRFEQSSRNSLTPVSVEKFMFSERKNGKFDKGEPMPFPFNKANTNNEGSASISIDDKHLFFTTNINGNFDICFSDKDKEDQWGEIKNLGTHVNDPMQWDAQPSISPDGKTLYFASYRDSVNGTSDLYKTTNTGNGKWSNPVRLEDVINTTGNEKSPFIHPDNKTLYFSSDSLPGLGGYDIFICKKDEKGNWGKPVNLGYPINTENDEVGFYVATDGRTAYFASNKINGRLNYDIYSFELYKEIRPEQVLFIKGELRDANNTVPLAAKIELKNIATKESINIDYDTLTGKYASVVLFDNDYILSAKKEGYAFNDTYMSRKDTALQIPVRLDVSLKKIEVGSSYPLNNIQFERNSAILSESAEIMITNFADFLKKNPGVRVQIQGHTDDMGQTTDNQVLSDDRAKAVSDYILKLGIAAGRVSSRGFGESKPLLPNTTEENRAKNRRTEFFILSK